LLSLLLNLLDVINCELLHTFWVAFESIKTLDTGPFIIDFTNDFIKLRKLDLSVNTLDAFFKELIVVLPHLFQHAYIVFANIIVVLMDFRTSVLNSSFVFELCDELTQGPKSIG
jgi:hypothetical protein